MVRHKTRWLLVRIEVARTTTTTTTTSSSSKPEQKQQQDDESTAETTITKSDVIQTLKENIAECFGLVAAGPILDVQVRFLDATSRLALVRVPRNFCTQTRAAMTLTTTMSLSSSSTTTTQQVRRASLIVLSVHGCARTAKIATVRQIRRFYRQSILRVLQHQQTSSGGDASRNRTKDTDRLCRSMEEALDTLVNIDY